MTDEGFRFEGVSVAIDDATILDDVTLAVPPGVISVFAGPSGAGKSTLLRLCNRLEIPSAGTVVLDGIDTASIDPLALRRRAGMVFQRPAVFAGTVADNLRVAEPDLDAAGAIHVLERVGLDPALLERRADDLSGGEAQRMCIARALLTDPQVLLMDEATSALDVDAKLVVEALARDLVTQGLTVIWVTHDLEQAERIADRVFVIIDGHLVDDAMAQRCLASRTFVGQASTDTEAP